ncbi:unnamed protein product [Chrysoparadoxa australica]
MKLITLLSVLFLSTFSFAGETPSEEFMSVEAQNKYITNVAKNIRKGYWQSGHEDVYSHTTFVTKAFLDDHYKQTEEGRFESSLDSDEFSQLYRCVNSSKCELYLVSVSGSYWGGYGESAHFVLLYTNTKKSFEISHTIYAE